MKHPYYAYGVNNKPLDDDLYKAAFMVPWRTAIELLPTWGSPKWKDGGA